MISKYTYKKLIWIDVESPTREEIIELAETYNIPSLISEELGVPSPRPKVDRYRDMLFMILHFPTRNGGRGKTTEQEIDFVIGKNFILTIHYENVNALHEFAKLFEVNSMLDRSGLGDHSGFIFYHIIRQLYHDTSIELDEINRSIREIEHSVFDGHESKMVSVISEMNRTLVDFKQTIRFHKETLRSFESAGQEFFGEDFTYYLHSIIGEFNKVDTMIAEHKEILSDLRDTNDSLLTSKTNDIMTKLTIMNFIMLPLGLITWIFGMNGANFISGTMDFLIIIIAMALTGLVMFIYFRGKRWL